MARYIDADSLKLDIDLSKGASVLDMAISVIKAVNDAPTADVAPKSEVERLEREIKALVAFKEYFSDLYGGGLAIANYHQNGALEDFDNFYDAAEEEYEAELKKKYTGE